MAASARGGTPEGKDTGDELPDALRGNESLASTPKFSLGTPVRVSRDEIQYPPKGTWPKYRNREGVVEIVVTDPRPRLTEYGVSFSPSEEPVWFLRHELQPT